MTINRLPADQASVMSVFLYHAIFVPDGIKPPPFEIILQKDLAVYIDGFGDNDYGVYAEIDGKPIGAAWARVINGFGHVDIDTPELAISVLPAYRGKGAGAAMLDALFAQMREGGVTQTSLAVQTANRAVNFYLRNGYKIIGEKEEEYVMLKKL